MKKYCNTKKISRKKKKINKLMNYYKLIEQIEKQTEKQKDENLSSEHAKLKWIKLFSNNALKKLKGYKL